MFAPGFEQVRMARTFRLDELAQEFSVLVVEAVAVEIDGEGDQVLSKVFWLVGEGGQSGEQGGIGARRHVGDNSNEQCLFFRGSDCRWSGGRRRLPLRFRRCLRRKIPSRQKTSAAASRMGNTLQALGGSYCLCLRGGGVSAFHGMKIIRIDGLDNSVYFYIHVQNGGREC